MQYAQIWRRNGDGKLFFRRALDINDYFVLSRILENRAQTWSIVLPLTDPHLSGLSVLCDAEIKKYAADFTPLWVTEETFQTEPLSLPSDPSAVDPRAALDAIRDKLVEFGMERDADPVEYLEFMVNRARNERHQNAYFEGQIIGLKHAIDAMAQKREG